MIDLNRDCEEDERRVNTDPLEHDKKIEYESKPNPFMRGEDDPEHPNNCYPERARGPKKFVDPANVRTKII